jgi:hypothetical protein
LIDWLILLLISHGSIVTDYEVSSDDTAIAQADFNNQVENKTPKLLNTNDPNNCTFAGLQSVCDAPKIEGKIEMHIL